MTVISCRKCGSENIRKNGFTKGGAQKYHRRACKFYGTPVTQEEKQNKKRTSYSKAAPRTRVAARNCPAGPCEP